MITPFHSSKIISPFDDPEILTASVNKPEIR
jgi:hypothetical protein